MTDWEEDWTIGDDIIDTRQIDHRIERFSDDAEANDIDPIDAEELLLLLEFRDELKGYIPDWDYGEGLIHERYFTTYAQELAEDTGMVEKTTQWPNYCIDWDRAATELKHDYTSADIGDHTYWGR